MRHWLWFLFLVAATIPAQTQLFNLARFGTVRAFESPFNGVCNATPASFTTQISAINYDCGGQGIAYSSFANPAYSGCGGTNVGYRPDSMFMQAGTDSGVPFSVGCLKPADYIRFTVSVSSGGPFTISLRLANIENGAFWNIIIDGVSVASVTVPNTGGYSVFQTSTSTSFNLGIGNHIVELLANIAGPSGFLGNINWLQGNISGGGGGTVSAVTMTNGPPNIPFASAGNCTINTCSWIQANVNGIAVSDVYADLIPMSSNYSGQYTVSDSRFMITTTTDSAGRSVGHITTTQALPAGDYLLTVTAVGAGGSNSVNAMVHAVTGTSLACSDAALTSISAPNTTFLLAPNCTYHIPSGSFQVVGSNTVVLGAGCSMGVCSTVIDGTNVAIGGLSSNGFPGNTGVMVANLTIQGMGTGNGNWGGATASQYGAFMYNGWSVRNTVIQNSTGICLGINGDNGTSAGLFVANNIIKHCGYDAYKMALNSGSQTLTFAGNEIVDLDYGLNANGDAGSKLNPNTASWTINVTNNYFHAGFRSYLWPDTTTGYTINFAGNTVLTNASQPITYEGATGTFNIFNNFFEHNYDGTNPCTVNTDFSCQGSDPNSAQPIVIAGSNGANIHDNDFSSRSAPVNAQGLFLAFYEGCTQTLNNNTFHDNTANFYAGSGQGRAIFDNNCPGATGNSASNNHYHLISGNTGSDQHWSWANGRTLQTFSQWQSAGQDASPGATIDTTENNTTGCTHVACSSAGVGTGGVPQ